MKGEGVGAGVGPDAVADVVHDAVGGDGDSDMVGAFAADFPPDDVSGLDWAFGWDHLPVGVVGEVRADVGDAAVVDVGVGRLAIALPVLIDFILQVEARAAQGADDDISAHTCGFRDISHRESDVHVVRYIAHKVVQFRSTGGNSFRTQSAVDATGRREFRLVGEADGGFYRFRTIIAYCLGGVGVEQGECDDNRGKQESEKKKSAHAQ